MRRKAWVPGAGRRVSGSRALARVDAGAYSTRVGRGARRRGRNARPRPPFPPPRSRSRWRKLSRFQRSAYRVAELLVETVRELADARGDLIEVHGLLSPVALHDVHGHFVLVAPSP